jgi:hypothetical protein
MYVDPGQNLYRLNAVGGVRLYIDGSLTVDRWNASSVDIGFSIGTAGRNGEYHNFTLEFRKNGGSARASVFLEANIPPCDPPWPCQ